ncbi:ABC transporter substrate-binding protein [Actinoplanes couchii]|uniref:ABC transporter substrate-binding protein n=1 Tax=Actinoplanes couchii TaxID=403638 RepID=A0ABQ3XP00_9ACTN|nr:extracellular solute-binding protein [Actinoplanes couchii]MDR6318634.1 ABC-type glycerol-3-phosphate transport system substrate-binding protein [Actinoplanes couchii]GID60242.1 ABC transporter substrate-binding protein [Actinoplanes couchii]
MAAVGVLALASSLLAACGSDDKSGSTDGLVFMNQSRGQEAALNELAKKYTETTGVKITIESPGPADYLPKLQSKAQSKSMPDIYSSFNATDMAPFYRAGWAKDLSAELQGDWSKNFDPAVVKLSAFADGNNLKVPAGIYTVHWEIQTYGFLADPAATGIDKAAPPQTMDKFIAGLATKGPGKFTVAASLTPQLVQSYASNYLTDEQISQTLDGKLPWKSDGWRKAFQLLIDMKQAGILANNALPGGQDDNPNVESSFFNKKEVGSIFDATAGVSVGLRTAPDFNDYISLALPAAPDATQKPRVIGLNGKGAVINPKGANVDKAVAFVKWLTEPDQQKFFAEKARILPSNPELLKSGTIPGQLTGFAEAIQSMQVLPNTISSDVNTTIIRNTQRLVLGEATVDQVLDEIQAAQDRSK